MLRWTLQLHKWIALVVGIQVLLWALGGLVMTVIPIERVRGEHHVPEAVPTALPTTELLSLTEAAAGAGFAPTKAELRQTPRGPIWALSPAKGEPAVLDARTGARLAPYSADQARAFALRAYRGEGSPVRVALLSSAPQETGKEGALWRVDFADAEHTTLYLAPLTGEVVSRRSGLWRFYDFFWRLHIMDWTKGENFNHPLIIGAALLALTTILSGFVLLWSRLGRDWVRLRSGRRGPAALKPSTGDT
ncbi:MAG: PepSY domain-containing protein [Caulobacter sp.]|nr:PepSY domain-containing protein [Caulobacter sp.]